MAYRKIHDDFWTDPDMEDLTPEQKYFYLYLITNPSVNQIGLYEFSLKRACFELGYNMDTVSKLLDTFEKMGKIKKSETSKEILVIKFYWHNKSGSPKLKKHVSTLLEEVKDRVLIQYIYGMDTASQEEEEKEKEKEEKKEKEKPAKPDVEGLDIPDYSEWWRYAESKAYHPDYSRHLFDSLLSRGWCNKDDQSIKDWQAYLRMMFKYQRGWIKKQKQITAKNGADYVPSYYQSLD